MLLMLHASVCIGCLPPACYVNFSVSPSDPRITTTPSMPAIEARVTFKDPFYASVAWWAQVTHTAPSGCVGQNVFTSTSSSGTANTFRPGFAGFYGGTVTIRATCSAYGYGTTTRTKTTTIKGNQPSKSAIIAEIGTVTSPFDGADLRRVACHESGLQQFSPTGSGFPYYGPGGDAGIMQRCYLRNNNDLWHWRLNVSAGRSTLYTSRNSAQNHLNYEVNVQGASPYTTQMFREEGIHRYNAGTGSGNEYWEWNTTVGAWQKVDRGGVGGYVGKVLNKGANCMS